MTAVIRDVISIESDRVVKTGVGDALCIEAEKTRQAQRIGERTGWFRAPHVLGFDHEAGRLELERIEGIRPLIERLRGGADSGPLLMGLGRSLAALHADTALPDHMHKLMADEWLDPAERNVVVHGDLSVQNVQVEADGESLVILDFSMSPRLALSGTVGPRTIDLAWFSRNLFLKERPWQVGSARPAAETIAFLTGYFEHAGDMPPAGRLASSLADLNDRFSALVSELDRVPKWRRWMYQRRVDRFGSFVRDPMFVDRMSRGVARFGGAA